MMRWLSEIGHRIPWFWIAMSVFLIVLTLYIIFPGQGQIAEPGNWNDPDPYEPVIVFPLWP